MNDEKDKIKEQLLKQVLLISKGSEAYILNYEGNLNIYAMLISKSTVHKYLSIKREENTFIGGADKSFILFQLSFLTGTFLESIKKSEIPKNEVGVILNEIDLAVFFLLRKLQTLYEKKKNETLAKELDSQKEKPIDLKVKEKMILLSEFGILGFLKDQTNFRTSTNRLAKAIALLLGEKQTTIQSYLNPMLSEGVSQKNNPYNNNEIVESVKKKIEKLE